MSDALEGKTAAAFMKAVFDENERRHTDQLAVAKLKAAESGKEPFDLDKLGEYIDLVWRCEYADLPVSVSRERKVVFYEDRYYLTFPDVMTIKAFAVEVEKLRRWDSD